MTRWDLGVIDPEDFLEEDEVDGAFQVPPNGSLGSLMKAGMLDSGEFGIGEGERNIASQRKTLVDILPLGHIAWWGQKLLQHPEFASIHPHIAALEGWPANKMPSDREILMGVALILTANGAPKKFGGPTASLGYERSGGSFWE